MRFYEITITPKGTLPNGAEGPMAPVTFSTRRLDGGNNPAALQIELDVTTGALGTTSSVGMLAIYGVDFGLLNQQKNFFMADIDISVGMSAGLPFAAPVQMGQIVRGTIHNSFGNWFGNHVRLDIYFVNRDTASGAIGFSQTIGQGETLESSVRRTLRNAFPNAQIEGGFSQGLVYTEDQQAHFTSLPQYAAEVLRLSKQINQDPTYRGAQIIDSVNGFILSDGTIPAAAGSEKAIRNIDLVGNITWIHALQVQLKVVMRGDLVVEDEITLPRFAPAVFTQGAAWGGGAERESVSFEGKFRIINIRHVGNSRSPMGDGWVTIIDCIPSGR